MSEMVFNFRPSLAQEESRSISENTIWALDKLAEKGIRRLGQNKVFGYDEKNGILVPNAYAPAVKMIFEEYAKGTRVRKIEDYLEQMGCISMRTRKRFSSQAIASILSDVIYKGDRLIQKRPHINYLTKKADYTREFNQYYIEGARGHVSKELWDRCQAERREGGKQKRWATPVQAFRQDQGSSHLCLENYTAECGSNTRKTKMYKGLTEKSGVQRNKGECHKPLQARKTDWAIGRIDYDLLEKVFLKENGEIEVHYKTRYYPIFQEQTSKSIG